MSKIKEFFQPTIFKIILTLTLIFLPRYNFRFCDIVKCYDDTISFLVFVKNLIYYQQYNLIAYILIWILFAYLISSGLIYLVKLFKKN